MHFSPHMQLWQAYTVLFVFLAFLIPCLWVAYIWDQIIDPHYESDSIAIPDQRLLRLFYFASKKITTLFILRTPIFVIVALLFVTTAILDVVSSGHTCIHIFDLLHPFLVFSGYDQMSAGISKGIWVAAVCTIKVMQCAFK